MNDHEQQLHATIELQMLKDVHRHAETIMHIMRQQCQVAEFNSMKYKEIDTYNEMLEIKRATNVLNNFLKVTKQDAQ